MRKRIARLIAIVFLLLVASAGFWDGCDYWRATGKIQAGSVLWVIYFLAAIIVGIIKTRKKRDAT